MHKYASQSVSTAVMYNGQLQWIASRDARTSSIFLGIAPADRQPQQMAADTTLIVNCCNARLPGRHWLALYQHWNGGLEVFDSFGMNPQFYDIVGKFPEASVITYSSKQLQSMNSSVCGLYCLYYCYYKARGYALEDIVSVFSNDRSSNDAFVRDMVDRLFNLL